MDSAQLLEDIKQLLRAEISQSEQRIIEGLRSEMHEGFQGIAEIITEHNNQLDNHEERLTVLETLPV